MATLTVQGLSKTYGKKMALRDIDLDIGDGEFFCMLGPSGAGKTTTLKSIAGLQEIDAGVVKIAGVDMTGVEPYHRNVAMAFESYALYPQKTVFENLASPLRSGRSGSFSAAAQQERIDTVTTTLGINHLQQRLPRELSNGQRQRVALGRVLVRPADVYLLDEPLSHLDAKLRASMRAELKRLGQMSNTTTVYVTHDYQEALSLGDRIGVLRAGEMVQVGTPADIWLRPLDTFVARALGQPEMNLFDAEVIDGHVVALQGAIRFPVTTDLGGARRVRIGMRPGDLHAGHQAVEGSASVLSCSGTIDLAERLGRQIELSVKVGDTDVIVVADGSEALEEGSAVSLSIPLTGVHLFEGTDDPSVDTRRISGAVHHAPGNRQTVTISKSGV
ncbi:ABC-type sugar transport system ATPase subunit [Nakamurella sp. UYEF19]|uniref:ABC transporter ATP-binding protein n=1 Tax=Nakamurella sp. UYEF19 TaxID=1756392 RepID=UPI003393E0BC